MDTELKDIPRVQAAPSAHISTQREQCTLNGILATLNQLQEVIQSLETHHVTASNFVLSLLQDSRLHDQPCVQNLKQMRFCWLSMSTPNRLNQHWNGQVT